MSRGRQKRQTKALDGSGSMVTIHDADGGFLSDSVAVEILALKKL
jgi:hypothetical protein